MSQLHCSSPMVQSRPVHETPAERRRERRRDRSREEILEAARSVLLRKGLAGTTLDAVAREVGVSKPAIYYYFPSKSALLFELVFDILRRNAQAVDEAVDRTGEGPQALRALIGAVVGEFAPRMDDFRLAFLHGQIADPGSVHFDQAQFARVRPLNDLWLAGAAQRLAAARGRGKKPAAVEPRLMAFLAFTSCVGLLTMKGMVESVDDPLLYTDEQLVEGLATIFEAAASS